MEEIYDLIILGGGPAGLSAGIYSGRAKLKTLIIEKENFGGLITKTQQILNYPGFYNISGEELGRKLTEHVKELKVETVKDAIREVELGDIKVLKSKRNVYKSKTLILATGTKPKILGIKGEKEFIGSGVAYCATCDAEFFENQEVVVVGSGDQAIEESFLIAKYASKVKIIVLHEEGKVDCNKLSAEKALNFDKFEFIWNSTLEEIIGENDKVTEVKIKNLKTNQISKEKCKGVFMFVGMVPNSSLFKDKVILNKSGFIEVAENFKTSVDGVFAAGDVVAKSSSRQVITASSEGALSAIEVSKYIDEIKLGS
ncbi:FAD-dependent oxidoreductase [Cetobacterium somerae]|uniref:NAD(P)/FAD-dependent oxidoreductase n=1 Tax=Cetobacterium somerae TaxID=188913 RepID=UPI00211F3720|nr:FAD-dependent oxidoreductase [Cetobacterium somerae]MCQ9627237.1 FAD-dependent oxidoreductase [Cetobacterium somerae]